MKITLQIVFIFIIASCSIKKNQLSTSYNKLSKFYNDTTFVEFYQYPDDTYDNPKYLFNGTLLDSSAFSLLNNKATNDISLDQGFYGVFSFKINNKYKGLITRTPGEYSPSAISLWIYDLKNDSVTNNVLLADIIGDAGSVETSNSYLFFDKSQQLHAFKYRHYRYDHSVGDEDVKDTTIETYHNYYLTKITNNSIDTLSTDSLKLCKQFKNQLNKMLKY